MTNDILRLVGFWGIAALLFGFMILMAWWFKIGDVHMIRRTTIYFISCFIVLPGLALLLFTYSESLAKAFFVPAILLGTIIYLVLTFIGILRPKG